MHELSIALSLVDLATQEAERRRVRVVAVHLRLGPLTGVVEEALRSSYAVACEGSPLAGSTLVICPTPIVAWCATCGREQTIASPQRLRCPACGNLAADLRGGRELELAALEVLDDPTAGATVA